MDEKVDKVSFGVSQFDNISLGRIEPGMIGLLYGPSGTGKTSVIFHYLFKGAREDQNVCMITSEPPALVASRMTRFNSCNQNWLRDGYISILNIFDLMDLIGVDLDDIQKGDIDLIHDLLLQTIDHLDAKRVVIDPVNPLVRTLDGNGGRNFFQILKGDIHHKGGSFMIVYDTSSPVSDWEDNSLSVHGLDIIIRFNKDSDPPIVTNTLTVERWRSSAHSRTSYAIDVSEDGVVIVPRIKPLEVR